MAGNATPGPAAGVDRADIQGNILRAYKKMDHVRHLVLRVADSAAARAFLGAMLDAAEVTSDATWKDRTPDDCLNIGITFAGLRALGVPEPSLAGFPAEFREGMVARAAKLGDIGPSAPEHWVGGLGHTDRVHLVATIHAREESKQLDRLSRKLESGRAFETLSRFEGAALHDDKENKDGKDGKDKVFKVHFGYRDGIAQPRFQGIPEQIGRDGQPLVPLGAVLLGHETPFPGLRWNVPEPEALGRNGAFNAFRVLGQDVVAFQDFLDAMAKEHAHHLPTSELVAAKLCGRWQNGLPLTKSLEPPDPSTVSLNDFDYSDDPSGAICPMGAHIRRCNPRSSKIVQRGANHTRRLVRRGMPYGPEFDPEHPDDVPRGLLGNFICASLAAQFEAVQSDWLNLGLHDPRISGTNDAISGTNDRATSRFEIPLPLDREPPVVLQGFSSFVTTRGGAYTFLPSLTALRWIAALPN